MATLNELREGLERAWDRIASGWGELRERTAQALTRFQPRRAAGGVESPERQVALRSARWGLLAADVKETADTVHVRVEIPGMDKDDFDLDVVDDMLVIRGEKEVRSESQEGRYHRLECAYGAFERAVPLPTPVLADKARARYHRGVLEVSLPKAAEARTQRIPVKGG